MLSPMLGYAATALGYVATKRNGPVQVREIAEARRIPAAYLAKIVQLLARSGHLATRRGSGGGVSLAVDPEKFTLLDLCIALDEPNLRPRCILGLSECSDSKACPGHAVSVDLHRNVIEFLDHTTLADVGRFDAGRKTVAAPVRKPGDRARSSRRSPVARAGVRKLGKHVHAPVTKARPR